MNDGDIMSLVKASPAPIRGTADDLPDHRSTFFQLLNERVPGV